MQNPLVQCALEVFRQFQTEEINEWSKQVWASDFDEVLDTTLSDDDLLQPDDGWIALLDDACKICRDWALVNSGNLVEEEEEEDGETNESNGFWLSLVENEISFKAIVAVCYWFAKKGREKSSSLQHKEASCLASALYFNLLRIPGSGAFSVFHPVVFQTCTNVSKLLMTLGNANESASGSILKSGKRRRTKSGEKMTRNKGKGKGSKKAKRKKTTTRKDDDDDDEDDMDISDNDSLSQHSVLTSQNESSLLDKICILLKSLVDMLTSFSLQRCEQSLHDLIHSLSELTRFNISCVFVNTRVQQLFLVPDLAYQALTNVCNGLHGDVTKIHKQIMKNLTENVFLGRGGTAASRNQNVIKEATVDFIVNLVRIHGDVTYAGVRTFLQNVCMKVPDKAEHRNRGALFLTAMLTKLPFLLKASFMKWLKKFVLNSKVTNRLLALEILSGMLSEKESTVVENVPSELLQVASHRNMLSTVVGRCCDKASSVRAKSLSILAAQATSSNEVNIIKELLSDSGPSKNARTSTITREVASENVEENAEENVDVQPDKESEARDDDNEEIIVEKVTKRNSNVICVDVHDNAEEEGNDITKEKFHELICHRCTDEKVFARKAALQVLESILKLVPQLIVEKNVVIIAKHCLDPALLVRKQAIQSMCLLLSMFPESSILQNKWVEGVLPLIFDGENSCQEKCMESVETIIFGNIVPYNRSRSFHHMMAWKILALISTPKYHDFQQYLKKICSLCARTGKLKSNFIFILQTHIRTENNDAVWLLLSQLLPALTIKDYSFVLDYWLHSHLTDQNPNTLERVLHIIGYTSKQTSEEKILQVIENLENYLKQYSSLSLFVPVILNSLSKLIAATCKTPEEAKDKRKEFCSSLIKTCDAVLSNAFLKKNSTCKLTEDEIIHYLLLLGEIALHCPTSITKKIQLLVSSLIATAPSATPESIEPGTSKDKEQPATSSQGSSQSTELSNSASKTPKVRAHSVVILGKLCLQDEKFAKKCVPALAHELEVSSECTIKNNVIVVLCDLCKRYTGLIDVYITKIAVCLKHPSMLISHHTLILLTKLLQEDYIKWKGPLFYHYITLLVDENPNIREMTKHCLLYTLLKRNPTKLYHHFLECIFHFNSYEDHPTYNRFPQTQQEIQLFSLKGSEGKQEKRYKLYKFMLENMADEHRFQITAKLVQEILGAFVDGILDLNTQSECLLQDTLAILIFDEIKLVSLRTVPQEEIDAEMDAAAHVVATAKKNIISQVVKKNVIENIVPVIISLKHMLEKKKSPLLRDLMMFLKDIMKDYKNEIKDVLAADNQLAKEIEFDINRFDQEEEERQLQKKKQANMEKNSPASRSKRNTSIVNVEGNALQPTTLPHASPIQSARQNKIRSKVAKDRTPVRPFLTPLSTSMPVRGNTRLSLARAKLAATFNTEGIENIEGNKMPLQDPPLSTTKTEPVSPPPETKTFAEKENLLSTPSFSHNLDATKISAQTLFSSTPVPQANRMAFDRDHSEIPLSPIPSVSDTLTEGSSRLILFLPPPK